MSILSELANDKKIIEACKKINYQTHKDLYQDLFVILCELPTGKLEKMKADGYLQFWIVRTILNLNSKTGSNYNYKKYIVFHDDPEATANITEPIEEEGEVAELEIERAKIESLLNEYERKGRDGFGWYKVTLLKLYAEVGTYRKMAELTGIGFTTISNDINTFRKELYTHLATLR